MSIILPKINVISIIEVIILIIMLLLIFIVMRFEKTNKFINTNKLFLVVIRNINVLLALTNTCFIITPFFDISASFKSSTIDNICLTIFMVNIISISINFGIIRDFEDKLSKINETTIGNDDEFSKTNSYVSRDKPYSLINIDKNNAVSVKNIPLQSNITSILQNNRKLAAYLKSFLKYQVAVSAPQTTEGRKILASGDENSIQKYLKDAIGYNNVFYKEVSRKIVEFDNERKELQSLNLNKCIDDLCDNFLIPNTAFIIDNKKDNIFIPELGLCLQSSSQDLATIKAIKFVKEKSEYKLEIE